MSDEHEKMMKQMSELLDEIEKVLPNVVWTKESPSGVPEQYETVAFRGTLPGWVFSVVGFSIEDQGFPPGTRGHDGMVIHGSTVIRLTRPLAEKAYAIANQSFS